MGKPMTQLATLLYYVKTSPGESSGHLPSIVIRQSWVLTFTILGIRRNVARVAPGHRLGDRVKPDEKRSPGNSTIIGRFPGIENHRRL
jgi:hypothetical protein